MRKHSCYKGGVSYKVILCQRMLNILIRFLSSKRNTSHFVARSTHFAFSLRFMWIYVIADTASYVNAFVKRINSETSYSNFSQSNLSTGFFSSDSTENDKHISMFRMHNNFEQKMAQHIRTIPFTFFQLSQKNNNNRKICRNITKAFETRSLFQHKCMVVFELIAVENLFVRPM